MTWMTYVMGGLRRRMVRTVLTVTGIAVCLAFLIVLSSLSKGMSDYLEDELKGGHIGYVTIRQSPAFTEEEYELIETIAEDELANQGYSGSLEVQCVRFLCYEYGTSGFAILEKLYEVVGIPPEGIKNPRIDYDFSEDLLEGHHLNDEKANASVAVLGYSVWKDLYPDVHVGDVIDLVPINLTWNALDLTKWTGQVPAEGEIAPLINIPSIPNVTVVGILAPSDGHNLDSRVLIPMEFMLTVFKSCNPTTGDWYYPALELVVENAFGLDYDMVEEPIKKAIPGISGWDNRQAINDEWIEAKALVETIDRWFLLVTVIMGLVTILSTSNTMAMSVTERSTEIGVLRAIGFRRLHIRILVYAEALAIIAFALVIGLVIGAFLVHIFDSNFDPEAVDSDSSIFFSPAKMGPFTVLLTISIALCFGLLAASLASRRASSIDILEVMRGE